MDEATATRYWCHMCSQTVNPVMEADDIKCPFCQTGFVQEMAQQQQQGQGQDEQHDETANNDSNQTDLNEQLQAILTRRRQLSAAFNRDSDRARLILINPSTQTITVHTSLDTDHTFLQRFAVNDPDRHGTPPARKEAIQALPSVKIDETLQCPVCLDVFEIGNEAKQMPCKHMLHGDCLLPWLELHSSCPVCRYLLPADQTKTDSRRGETSHNNGVSYGSVTSSHGTENSDEEEEDDD